MATDIRGRGKGSGVATGKPAFIAIAFRGRGVVQLEFFFPAASAGAALQGGA
jgi:hypothetical protein